MVVVINDSSLLIDLEPQRSVLSQAAFLQSKATNTGSSSHLQHIHNIVNRIA